MLLGITVAAGLVALTVTGHSAGLAMVLRWFMKWHIAHSSEARSTTWALIRVTWVLVVIHVAEVLLWALLYVWCGSLRTSEEAIYFSGVTYTTIGYGDVVLPDTWRILAPIEGLIGILMVGLSASLFFAIMTKIYGPVTSTQSSKQ